MLSSLEVALQFTGTLEKKNLIKTIWYKIRKDVVENLHQNEDISFFFLDNEKQLGKINGRILDSTIEGELK